MIMKRLLSFFLAVCVAISAFSPYTSAAGLGGYAGTYDAMQEKVSQILAGARDIYGQEIDRDSLDIDLISNGKDGLLQEIVEAVQIDENEIVPVIIVLDEESVVERDGFAEPGVATFSLTEQLADGQDKVIAEIESDVLEGEALDIQYRYTWLLNGIAAQIPYGKLKEIQAIDGVKNVILQRTYTPMTSDGYSPYSVSDGPMIGREDTWGVGYTGEGIKIAVLDTGIDDDHPNFGALPQDKLNEHSATPETIEEVLGQLNAYSGYRGDNLTADKLYLSTKVAYAYNYADDSLRINHVGDSQGTHGTHVAGIAAANKIDGSDVVGVAPDAQLYIMKVFGNGGPTDSVLLAAIEDSLILGADVINMSLGSAAGFTTDTEEMNELYARVGTTGTILSISAGNSGAMGEGNLWGSGSNLTSNPDNSTISSPSTYQSALSVASVNNAGTYGFSAKVNDKEYILVDGTGGPNKSISTLAGKEYQIAVVGNLGQTLEDFTAAGVEGKIALVERGISTFVSKCDLAAEAGAVACIIYNNVSGSFGLAMNGGTSNIPCAALTRSEGLALLEALDEDAGAVMVFTDSKSTGFDAKGWQISDFSSWGVSPDLTLKPDIAAPGGNIYSTVDGGGYAYMSGTSMAAPNLSGISALVIQYVRDEYPDMAEKELHDFVNSLLMSTAAALPYDEDGLYISPRSQGAGIANAFSAINTDAILHVEGSELPKIELFDDPGKTGVYNYSFQVENLSEDELTYVLTTVVQTETVDYDEETEQSYMALAPYMLDADVQVTGENVDAYRIYDFNSDGKTDSHDAYILWKKLKNLKDGEELDSSYLRYDVLLDGKVDDDDIQAYLDELVEKNRIDEENENIDLREQHIEVTIAAASTENINVAITLDANGKAYMDANFENGIYVDGFTFLTAQKEDGVDLSIPFMGFYGDWTQAPSIDSAFYWDDFANGRTDVPTGSQYFNVLLDNWGWTPGINYYFYGSDDYQEEFDPAHISLSPNEDGYADYIDDIYVSLLRNAAVLDFTYTDITDSENKKLLFEQPINYVPKSYFNDSDGMIYPFVYSPYGAPYYMTDANGDYLADGTKVLLSVKAELDYDTNGRASANLRDTWDTVITIDNTAPVLMDEYKFTEQDGQQYVTLRMHDSVSVAAVNFLNRHETFVLSQYPTVDNGTDGKMDDNGNIIYYVEGTPAEDGGVDYLFIANVTGYGNEFAVVLGDYAFNERAYLLKTKNNDPQLDGGLLYGYRIADEVVQDASLYGWLSIDSDTAGTVALDNEYYVDYALDAAEYVDGYILAADTAYVIGYGANLVWIKPGYWDERHKITTLDVGLREMALDPTTGTLYGITGRNDWPSSALVTIDLVYGYTETVSQEWPPVSLDVLGMTVGTDGTLYAVNGSGELKTINKETGEWNDAVLLDTTGVTGGIPTNSQSMTFDDDNNCIYWAYYGTGNAGTLYRIDDPNGAATIKEIGAIAGNAEVVGLLRMDDRGCSLPESELLELYFAEDQLDMVVGDSGAFEVMSEPWYKAPEELIWSSSDKNVATVSDSGDIKAVGVGIATITAKTTDGAFTVTGTVMVTEPKAQLYGYVNGYSVWATFAGYDPAGTLSELSDEVLYMDFIAGEYLDGYVYAFNDSQAFYRIDAETFEATKLTNARTDISVYDMAYDYTTGFMYGIVQIPDSYSYSYDLVHIDINSGAMETVCTLQGDLYTVGGLAVSNDGTLYTLDDYGALCIIDPETGELNTVGLTGQNAPVLSSMAYDHDNEELYLSSDAGIFFIDTGTGAASYMGSLGGYAFVQCLYAIPDEVPELDYVPVEDVVLDSESLSVLTGMSRRIPATVYPFNATNRDIEWTVEDTDIAVIEDGAVYGVSEGTTTATGRLEDVTVTLNIKVLPSCGELYAFILSDLAIPPQGQDFWAVFDDADPNGEGGGLAQSEVYELHSGEYYDGLLYACANEIDGSDTYFVVFDTNDNYSIVWSAPMSYDLRDMAFDYTEGVMYAVGGQLNASGDNLFAVDIDTGDCYLIGATAEELVALACLSDGTIVGVGVSGTFYHIDKTDGTLEAMGDTGYPSRGYQSMAYDHNTGNLYWAQLNSGASMWDPPTSALLIVDPEDGSVTELGVLGLSGCQATGLYTVPAVAPEIGTPEITGIKIANGSSAMLAEGDELQLIAKLTPISVKLKDTEITYSSNDTSVADVTDSGVVYAYSAGTAIITASYDGFSADIKVTVVGNDTEIYVVSSDGMEIYPLLKPTNWKGSVQLSDFEGELVAAAYNGADGYFYGISKDGWLWKYNASGAAEKVGSAPVTELLSNSDELKQKVEEMGYYGGGVYAVDIVYNSFDSKMYLVAGAGYSGDDRDYVELPNLYRLNVTSGEGELVCDIPTYSSNYGISVYAITFVSETDYLIYDGSWGFMYRSTVGSDSVSIVAMLQFDLFPNGYLGMVYSAELDLVFLAGYDSYNHSGTVLYSINPDTGIYTLIGEAGYRADMVDLILIEGVEPVALADTAEDESAEDEVSDELSEDTSEADMSEDQSESDLSKDMSEESADDISEGLAEDLSDNGEIADETDYEP